MWHWRPLTPRTYNVEIMVYQTGNVKVDPIAREWEIYEKCNRFRKVCPYCMKHKRTCPVCAGVY